MAIVAERTTQTGNPLLRAATAMLAVVMQGYGRFAALIGALLLAAYVALSAASVLVLPENNWDLLPYIAVAGEASHQEAQSLHDFAYDAVRQGVGDAAYASLAHGDEFRQVMNDNAADFVSLLGMYRVKYLYAQLLSGLSSFMQPVMAVRAVSIASTLAFGLVTLLWLRALNALALAPLVAGVMIVSGFGDVARVGTPDMFCAALFMAGMFAYARKAEAVSALFLVLAVMARPDNVIFMVLFALLIGVSRLRAPGALAAATAALVAYVAISHWAQHPGWWPHLYFSTLLQAHNMTAFHPEFSLAAYLKMAGKAAYLSLEYNNWVGVVLLCLGGWLVPHLAGLRMDARAGVAFTALLLSIGAKFVVFPIHDTRVYFPVLLPLLLLALPGLMQFGHAAFQRGRMTKGIAS